VRNARADYKRKIFKNLKLKYDLINTCLLNTPLYIFSSLSSESFIKYAYISNNNVNIINNLNLLKIKNNLILLT